MLSACLQLFTLTSKLPFLVFLTFFRVALEEIMFSIRKGKNLASQTSSKDSIIMNLGKSSASFSKSDSDRFHLVFFFIGKHNRCCIFFAGPVLCHPPWTPTSAGNVPRGKPFHLG